MKLLLTATPSRVKSLSGLGTDRGGVFFASGILSTIPITVDGISRFLTLRLLFYYRRFIQARVTFDSTSCRCRHDALRASVRRFASKRILVTCFSNSTQATEHF